MMTKRAPKHSGDDILTPAPHSPAFSLLTAFQQCPMVPPSVLQDWLSESIERFGLAALEVHHRHEELRDGKDAEKLQAGSVYINALNFIDVAKSATPFAQDNMPATVTQALMLGIRLGLLHERLEGLANDQFKKQWVKDEVLEGARDAKKKQGAGPASPEGRQRAAAEKLKQVQKTMPTRTLTVQKTQAAKELGIGLRTLNRWLNPTKK